MKVKLQKGRTSVGIDIPDEKVWAVLNGEEVPGINHDTIRQIIADGVKAHCPDDIVHKKVAIIIPDDTRLWVRGDLFVPVIVQSLFDLGVSQGRIKIIIALGTHADMEEVKFAQLAGAFCAGSVEILNSANHNRDRLVHFGKTSRNTRLYFTKEAAEAEHIIIFGGILHHLIAGFGGGRKYILPGIAGHESIMQNHALAIQEGGTPHPLVQPGMLSGNPIHEDVTEAADLFLADKTCTYIAIAANGSGDIFHCDAGPLKPTFLDGCEKLDRACGIGVPERGDFALISAGGHRTDGQLYQAVKALFNTVDVVKQGGDILLVAACTQGVGNDIFVSALKDFRNNPQGLGSRLSTDFSMPSYIAFRLIDVLQRFRVSLYSEFDKPLAKALGFNPVENIGSYVRQLNGKGYIIPHAEKILPVVADQGRR